MGENTKRDNKAFANSQTTHVIVVSSSCETVNIKAIRHKVRKLEILRTKQQHAITIATRQHAAS